MKSFALDSKGFSLISTIIAVAISGILILALVTSSLYTNQAQRNVRISNDFVDVAAELRMVMSGGKNANCTFNVLRALDQYRAKSGIAQVDLRDIGALEPMPMNIGYFNTDGILEKEYLREGIEFTGMLFKSIRLVPKANLATGKVLFEVVLVGEKTGSILGSKSLLHTLPILANVDANGAFVSCSSSGTFMEEKVCDLLNGGEYVYDPKTGTCLPLFSTKCFPGGKDAREAVCPEGEATGCESNVPDPDDDSKSHRDYEDGSFREIKPKPYQCTVTGATTVRCVYARDLKVGPGVVCSPCCKIKNQLPSSVPQ